MKRLLSLFIFAGLMALPAMAQQASPSPSQQHLSHGDTVSAGATESGSTATTKKKKTSAKKSSKKTKSQKKTKTTGSAPQ